MTCFQLSYKDPKYRASLRAFGDLPLSYSRDDLQVLNRGAIVLKYREPMIRWINEAHPYDKDPGITAESLVQVRTVYLISENDADGEPAVDRWVRCNFEMLFENEPADWYADPDLWSNKKNTSDVSRMFRG